MIHNLDDFAKLLRSHAADWLQRSRRQFDRDEWPTHSGVAKRRGPEAAQNDLTEIEEGRFLQINAQRPGFYSFRESALPYALGLLINAELSTALGEIGSVAQLDSRLNAILDPIRGFDSIADMLAAATGLSCLDPGCPVEICEALIRAWCGLQNVGVTALESMAAYVPIRAEAFLRVAGSGEDAIKADGATLIVSQRYCWRDESMPPYPEQIKHHLVRWLGWWSRRRFEVVGDTRRVRRGVEPIAETESIKAVASLNDYERSLFYKLTIEHQESSRAKSCRTYRPSDPAGGRLMSCAEGFVAWSSFQGHSRLIPSQVATTWMVCSVEPSRSTGNDRCCSVSAYRPDQ